MSLVKSFKVWASPVIDGVVVRGRGKFSVVIKKADDNILLDEGKANSISKAPLVFIRGIIAAFENLFLLCKMLFYSTEYFDSVKPSFGDTGLLSRREQLIKEDMEKAEKSQKSLAFGLSLFCVIIGIIVFLVVPIFISSLFIDNARDGNWLIFNTIKCVIRIIFLILFFVAFKYCGGMFNTIRQYNAAINKAMNCFENGKEMLVNNAKEESAFHPRADLYVLFLTVVIFSIALIFVKMDGLILAILIRLGILVLSIGVAYEISRFFGMFNGKLLRSIAMICGMWTEFFTIDEPTDTQLYMAIVAINNSMTEV